MAKTGKEWGISSLTAETFQGPYLKKNDIRSTVDGSEIRRSPVEGKVVYPVIYSVLDIRIPGGAGFLPSTVSLQFSLSIYMYLIIYLICESP